VHSTWNYLYIRVQLVLYNSYMLDSASCLLEISTNIIVFRVYDNCTLAMIRESKKITYARAAEGAPQNAAEGALPWEVHAVSPVRESSLTVRSISFPASRTDSLSTCGSTTRLGTLRATDAASNSRWMRGEWRSRRRQCYQNEGVDRLGPALSNRLRSGLRMGGMAGSQSARKTHW
jgi:hypothetical protein